MIVDDDAQVLVTLEYEVVAHADSRAAAQQIKAEKFDGIFVDAYMPQVPELPEAVEDEGISLAG